MMTTREEHEGTLDDDIRLLQRFKREVGEIGDFLKPIEHFSLSGGLEEKHKAIQGGITVLCGKVGYSKESDIGSSPWRFMHGIGLNKNARKLQVKAAVRESRKERETYDKLLQEMKDNLQIFIEEADGPEQFFAEAALKKCDQAIDVNNWLSERVAHLQENPPPETTPPKPPSRKARRGDLGR